MIKTITLTYDLKDFEKMLKIKERKALSWDDFILWCVLNYGRGK